MAGQFSGIYAAQAMEDAKGRVDAPEGSAAETDRIAVRKVNTFRDYFTSWEEAGNAADHAVADAWAELASWTRPSRWPLRSA